MAEPGSMKLQRKSPRLAAAFSSWRSLIALGIFFMAVLPSWRLSRTRCATPGTAARRGGGGDGGGGFDQDKPLYEGSGPVISAISRASILIDTRLTSGHQRPVAG